MSHEVETMVFSGAVPWHGLGTPIDDTTTFAEGFQKAELDWTVDTKPLYTSDGVEVTHRAAYRTSDGRILGIVGPRWTPLQNSDAFDLFEPLVEAGDLKLHTAGSLRNGERVWVLLEMAGDVIEIAKNDAIARFVLLSNGHDGKLAVRLGFTPIRVVCANTEAMARSSKASKLIRVRHNKFVKENCEKLRDIMNLANQEFEATADQYRFLASRSIKKTDLRKYVKIVLDLQNTGDDDLSTRSKNIMERVEWYFENGQGNNLEGVTGTWWAAYNAVTEYYNHEQGRNANNRVDSLWFGNNSNTLTKAFDQAVALAS